MAIKISVTKKEKSRKNKKLMDNLLRAHLQVNFLDQVLHITYVPMLQTLTKMVVERKGLVAAAEELFNQFIPQTRTKKNTKRKRFII